MPNNAPAAKRAATAGYGATVVEYDPEEATREEVVQAEELIKKLRAKNGTRQIDVKRERVNLEVETARSTLQGIQESVAQADEEETADKSAEDLSMQIEKAAKR